MATRIERVKLAAQPAKVKPAKTASIASPAAITNTANYTFSTAANASLTDMSSGTTTLVAAGADDTVSAVTNIGFDFFFNGTRYSQFSTSDNGIIQLGSTQISTSLYVLPSTTLPLIAPFGDDLRVGTDGVVRSKVIGTAPNRVLVVEHNKSMIRYLSSAAAGTGTWQTRLYESTGQIEFVYGAMATNSATQNPVYIGFSSNGITSNTFATVTTSSHTVNTTGALASNTYSSNATITDLNSVADGEQENLFVCAANPHRADRPELLGRYASGHDA